MQRDGHRVLGRRDRGRREALLVEAVTDHFEPLLLYLLLPLPVLLLLEILGLFIEFFLFAAELLLAEVGLLEEPLLLLLQIKLLNIRQSLLPHLFINNVISLQLVKITVYFFLLLLVELGADIARCFFLNLGDGAGATVLQKQFFLPLEVLVVVVQEEGRVFEDFRWGLRWGYSGREQPPLRLMLDHQVHLPGPALRESTGVVVAAGAETVFATAIIS